VALAGPQVPPNCDLTLGIVCIDKSRPGRTVWRMWAHERFANPLGVVQGGFLAACCDSAMGATVVTVAAGRPVRVANTEMSVRFLRPVRIGAEVTCEATVVAGGSRVVFAEAMLTAVEGGAQPTLAARASSTYLLLERT
jgi:uncharacterized protein (TIGR00369 family)